MEKLKIEQYIIAEGENITALESTVSKLISQGFFPQGGISTNTFPSLDSSARFIQAMIKY
ncbi:MAG: hypothetical protein COB81_11235 [Flavobacteriaceae bacterium]|nr:MAG: hypothetical protein COB81_11235 [Flavobacteriaceae bacterium]